MSSIRLDAGALAPALLCALLVGVPALADNQKPMTDDEIKHAAIHQSIAGFASKYPNLVSSYREKALQLLVKAGFDDIDAVADCQVGSFLKGIPEADLFLMDASLATHEATPDTTATFARWLGPIAVHGRGSGSIYADGTPRDVVAEQAAIERVRSNARELCPALAKKYAGRW